MSSINNRRNAAIGFAVTKFVFPLAKRQVKRKVASSFDRRQLTSGFGGTNGNGNGNGRTTSNDAHSTRDASIAIGALLGLAFFLGRRRRV